MDGEEVRCYLLLLLLLLLATLSMLAACEIKETIDTETLCFDGRCFQLEVAETFEEREIGLMNRTVLSDNQGMLFVFENASIYPFWMKDTLIPLDIIWLDDDLRVVRVLSAEPCTADPCSVYDPGLAARYVIELNKGTAETMQLKVGDSFLWKK